MKACSLWPNLFGFDALATIDHGVRSEFTYFKNFFIGFIIDNHGCLQSQRTIQKGTRTR